MLWDRTRDGNDRTASTAACGWYEYVVTETSGSVHRTNPFATPAELRDPARQFRGRLAAPVTVWTAGDATRPTGFTVSSLVIAEGPPPSLFGLVSINSDLWDVVQETGKFVVHVLDGGKRVMADVFAGIRPAPGGAFSTLDVEQTEWGPAIGGLATRAYCSFVGATDTGHHRLVQGRIDRVDLDELAEPLVYFRGAYRALKERGS